METISEIPGLWLTFLLVAGGAATSNLTLGFVTAAASGELGRNATRGYRTAATMASDEAWQAGHEAVLQLVRGVTYFSSAMAVVFLAAAAMLFWGDTSWVPIWLPAALILVWLVLGPVPLVWAKRLADRAAREVS